jgi:hypothetical protein
MKLRDRDMQIHKEGDNRNMQTDRETLKLMCRETERDIGKTMKREDEKE